MQAPSPPHIHVPQASEDKTLVLAPYNGFHCKPQHKQILEHITQRSEHIIGPKEWRYDLRRQAQPMVSYLYLGPSNAARDVEWLRKEGITLLLVIRDSTMAQARFLSAEKVANQLGVESDCVDVAGNTELIAAFPRAIERINDHLVAVFQHRTSKGMSPDDPASFGKVLVFCESGNERSATVVAAYLMHMYNLSEITAIQCMQTQRFCVAFDDGLKHLLRSYGDILVARSLVTIAGTQTPVSNLTTKSKRNRDEMDLGDGMELDMEQQDDVERFGKRSAFTPFRDTAN